MALRRGEPFHATFLKNVAEQMQEYVDEGDEHITLGETEGEVEFVLPVRHVAQLFNDLLLYMNGGCEPPLKLKIPPKLDTE